MIDDTKILHEIIAVQRDLIESQAKRYEAIIEKLMACVSELERQIKLDSSNSGKPLSSDGLKKKPRTTSLRCKVKKKAVKIRCLSK